MRFDVIGPFVQCNGAINRPMVDLDLPSLAFAKVKPIIYTATVRVFFEGPGDKQDVWHDCGSIGAYEQASNTMSSEDLLQFLRMETSFAVMDCGSASQAAYPWAKGFHPEGRVNHLSATVQKHFQLSKEMEAANSAKQALAYAERNTKTRAKVDGPQPVASVRAGKPARVMKPI